MSREPDGGDQGSGSWWLKHRAAELGQCARPANVRVEMGNEGGEVRRRRIRPRPSREAPLNLGVGKCPGPHCPTPILVVVT